jgi:coenzyme F420 hydrogenase subunit beta
MKASETILHLRCEESTKIKNMVPEHVWNLAKPYGLTPELHDEDQSA